MRVKAIVIIPRLQGQFILDQAEIFRRYEAFTGFQKRAVEAIRKGEGFGVALVLEPSQLDDDFGMPTVFLDQRHVDEILEAFKRSDELTYVYRGRGWFHGDRPFFKLQDFL